MKTASKGKKTPAEWYEKCVLTPCDVKRLIVAKLQRARMYHEADKKREAALTGRR